MKTYKRYLALLVVFSLFLSSFWGSSTANAAEKLSKKDFVLTGSQIDGEFDFLQMIEDNYYIGENGWGLSIYFYNKKTDKSKKGCIKTNRDIVLGSTLKSIKTAYGDAEDKKIKKDAIYNVVTDQADDKVLKASMKAAKGYIDYAYTYTDSDKYKNKITLRFYLDGDNKVSMVCLISNLSNIPY